MTRNRRNHHYNPNSYTQKGRDITKSIARRSLPLSDLIHDDRRFREQRRSVLDRGVEDRRVFHPLREIRNPRSISGGSSTIRPRSVSRYEGSVPQSLGFFMPEKVMLCVRRSMRRQVLHAKKIAGGTGFRPPRFNFWSTISCKE